MGGWFRSEIVDNDRLALFLCFAAFVVTFVVTRTITSQIRAGRGPLHDHISATGIHVHHAVPGLVLLISGAIVSVASGSEVPWAEIAAVMIGIGTSLVLDEFALILHLSDVYWSEEGRVSVQMVSLAIACMGLALVGFNPIDFSGTAEDNTRLGAVVALALFHIVVLLVCVAKGKYELALLGTFVPMLGVICALRLARPGSMWARRWYGDEKMALATVRAQRYDRRFGRFTGFIGRFTDGPTARTAAAGEA